jgi:hypothetical protein
MLGDTQRRSKRQASRSYQPRRLAVVGAITAFVLDVVVLILARVLAANLPVLTFLWLASLPGLAIAPILGWRFGPWVREPRSDWVGRAMYEVLVVTTTAWVVYVVGFFFLLGAPGPAGTEGGFVLYALLSGIAYAIIPILVAIIPIGLVWRGVVRTLVPHASNSARQGQSAPFNFPTADGRRCKAWRHDGHRAALLRGVRRGGRRRPRPDGSCPSGAVVRRASPLVCPGLAPGRRRRRRARGLVRAPASRMTSERTPRCRWWRMPRERGPPAAGV